MKEDVQARSGPGVMMDKIDSHGPYFTQFGT
jgi:hypothetical protein